MSDNSHLAARVEYHVRLHLHLDSIDRVLSYLLATYPPDVILQLVGGYALTATAVASNVLVLAAIWVRYFFAQCLTASGLGASGDMLVMMEVSWQCDMWLRGGMRVVGLSWSTRCSFIYTIPASSKFQSVK